MHLWLLRVCNLGGIFYDCSKAIMAVYDFNEGFALSSKGPSAGSLAETDIRIALRLPQGGKPEGKNCL